jgi:hypothetical protein
VRDDLKLAIERRGLVIDLESFVGRMLERTGKDVGSARRLYGDAQAFVFCSAVLSRKTMEADLANVAMCPYSIMVYATAQQPGTVNVSYRRPWRPDGSAASKAAVKEVEALLDGIAREEGAERDEGGPGAEDPRHRSRLVEGLARLLPADGQRAPVVERARQGVRFLAEAQVT